MSKCFVCSKEATYKTDYVYVGFGVHEEHMGSYLCNEHMKWMNEVSIDNDLIVVYYERLRDGKEMEKRKLYKMTRNTSRYSSTPDLEVGEERHIIVTAPALDIARLLDEELEDANHHSLVGMYEELYNILIEKDFGRTYIDDLFMEIYERGGLFNA